MTNKKTGKSARLIYFTQCNKVSKPPYHHIPLYPNLSQISHPPCLFISLGFTIKRVFANQKLGAHYLLEITNTAGDAVFFNFPCSAEVAMQDAPPLV